MPSLLQSTVTQCGSSGRPGNFSFGADGLRHPSRWTKPCGMKVQDGGTEHLDSHYDQ